MHDLTGKVFGRLTVLGIAPRTLDEQGRKERLKWRCQCECGNTIDVPTCSLNGGRTKSCGCMRVNKYAKEIEAQGFTCFSPEPDCEKSRAGICCNLCKEQCEYACHNRYDKCCGCG